MHLFDEYERSELNPEALSYFSVIDSSAHPLHAEIRDRCNDWFSRFPEGRDKRDLRVRFRDLDNHTHYSAWFELLLHETMRRLGCSLEVHPKDPGTTRRPDFLVHGGETSCYLEATVISATAADRRVTSHEEEVLEWIRSLKCSQFMLFPSLDGELYELPDKQEVLEPIREFLAESHPPNVAYPEENGISGPHLSLTFGQWTLELELIFGEPERSSGSIMPFDPLSTAALHTTDDLITDKIISKITGKNADSLSAPLVVAATMPTPNYMPTIDAIPRLLGPDVLKPVPSGSDPHVVSYQRGGEGVWIGPEGRWRNGNCHAVWLFPDAWTTSLSIPSGYQPWLFLNPLTEVDLPDELLRVSHVRIVNGEPPKWIDGLDLSQLLSGYQGGVVNR